jgi:hypothetical protein
VSDTSLNHARTRGRVRYRIATKYTVAIPVAIMLRDGCGGD